MQPVTSGRVLKYFGANRCETCWEQTIGPLPLTPEQEAAHVARRRAEREASERAALAADPLHVVRQDPARALATTTHELPGYRVVRTVDVVSAECAFGMGLFADFFTSLSDTFGGRSGTTQSSLRRARELVMRELRAEAVRAGGNAVIGVDLDYSEFSGQGKLMLFAVATGTAVIAVPLDAEAPAST